MKSLLETVTEMARATFPSAVTGENFEVWRQHWIDTGDKWASELSEEGLIETSSKVRDHVEFERKFQK